MATWFTADLHLSHSNIIRYCNRPFLNEDEKKLLADGVDFRVSGDSIHLMNKTLIDNINSVVGRDDTLWHLGDFCFSDAETARKLRDRINCQNINIVWGNHDRRGKIRHLFKDAYDQVEVVVEDQRMVLNHYAMAVWNKSHHGAWQLYGHSHAGAEQWMDLHLPNRRSVDVGVDNAFKLIGDYKPFSMKDLHNHFKSRTGHKLDHH